MKKKCFIAVLLTLSQSLYCAAAEEGTRSLTFTNNTQQEIVICFGKNLGSCQDRTNVESGEVVTLPLSGLSLMVATNDASVYAPTPTILDLQQGATQFTITYNDKNQQFVATPTPNE